MAAEQEDKYKAEKLGQLTAVSMLMIGRSPECLHPAVVRESFKQAQPHEIESIDDGQVMHDLLNIRNWNYDCLLDLSIIPGRKSKDPNLVETYLKKKTMRKASLCSSSDKLITHLIKL